MGSSDSIEAEPERIPRCEKGLEAGDSAQPAYARLFGPSVDFYLRTTQLDIGRTQKNPAEGSFLQLPDDKSISRKHATISWAAASQQFQMTVHGKNGVSIWAPGETEFTQLQPQDAPCEIPSRTLVRRGLPMSSNDSVCVVRFEWVRQSLFS